MNLGMLLLHSPVLKGEHLLRVFTRVLFTFCVIHVEEEAGRAVQLLRAGLCFTETNTCRTRFPRPPTTQEEERMLQR